ncbi:MAG: FAD-containing oxidoreductase, partial [Planctomycetota bacterium]|nr:FAD-containing oxidoreductase [Planctomycetota bacterium]
PEIAGVGATEAELNERGIAYDTVRVPFDDLDRTIIEEERTGFVKICVRSGGDRILGATVVGEHAGEAIAELTLAMTAGIGLKTIAKTVHPYPTRSEAIRRAADQLNRDRLTPRTRRWLGRWFRWTG